MSWWEKIKRWLGGEVAPSTEPAMPTSYIPLDKLPGIHQDGKAEQEERRLWRENVIG